MLDLNFLKKILPSTSKDKQLVENLQNEVQRLKQMQSSDNDYMIGKAQKL